jgi:hypothetical protein
MYGILLSALNAAMAWAFRSVVAKSLVFFALYFIVFEFTKVLVSLLSNVGSSSLTSALLLVPSSVWYFLDLFAFSTGVPMILSAVVTRFIIRRLPVIG